MPRRAVRCNGRDYFVEVAQTFFPPEAADTLVVTGLGLLGATAPHQVTTPGPGGAPCRSPSFERHQIFQWFEEVLGAEKAAIMVDLLSPVGWGDIATKADLRSEMAELRGEIKSGQFELRGEIKSSQSELLRTLFFAMVASNATLVGLVFAAVKLA